MTQKTFPLGEFTAEAYPEAHKFEVMLTASAGMPVSPKGNEYGRMHFWKQVLKNPHSFTNGESVFQHSPPVGSIGAQVSLTVPLQYDPTGQSMSKWQGDPILCKDTHTESVQVPL